MAGHEFFEPADRKRPVADPTAADPQAAEESRHSCDPAFKHGVVVGFDGSTSSERALAYAAFNGYQTATMNFQTFSQVAFAFRVTPSLLFQALFYALFMGFLGGIFPAIRAARLPIPSALREL